MNCMVNSIVSCDHCDDSSDAAVQGLAKNSVSVTNMHDVVVRIEKYKVFPYSFPSVGPGADPGVQAVSPQVTLSYPAGSRLPLLSVW